MDEINIDKEKDPNLEELRSQNVTKTKKDEDPKPRSGVCSKCTIF
jgi:hypothetical protein